MDRTLLESQKITLVKPCRFCQTDYRLQVNYSDYKDYTSGKGYIQNIFPYLSAGERELFISGMCNNCWEKTFGE